MTLSLIALTAGFLLDFLLGDPQGFPHPVIFIGKLISFLERFLRRLFPKTPAGEKTAGAVLWLLVITVSFGIPFGILWGLQIVSPWLRLAAESLMSWQILAAKSLKDESMKVYKAICTKDLEKARRAVSMIVGRDTEKLDFPGITRAAVETVAENTGDGVIAPLFYMILGGAPLGMLYKGVNTMDSMLGYIEPPYENIGMVPARMDDLFNFIPARISAFFMLLAGKVLGMNSKNGWKIFRRDRFCHASPNSAQTESVCAGLLEIRLAGDAWYHGALHKKEYIGDPIRPGDPEDIPRACRLLYGTAVCGFCILGILKTIFLVVMFHAI